MFVFLTQHTYAGTWSTSAPLVPGGKREALRLLSGAFPLQPGEIFSPYGVKSRNHTNRGFFQGTRENMSASSIFLSCVSKVKCCHYQLWAGVSWAVPAQRGEKNAGRPPTPRVTAPEGECCAMGGGCAGLYVHYFAPYANARFSCSLCAAIKNANGMRFASC